MMICPAAEVVTLSGWIHDKAGNPLAGITLVLSGIVEEKKLAKSLITDSEGKFSIEVPSGNWIGIPDEIELLERGYFCMPGWEWDPETLGGLTVSRPGEIVQFQDPMGMELIAVPIIPTLKVTGRDPGNGSVKLTAEFIFGEVPPPLFSANYQVYRSEDMKIWEPFTVIGMNNLRPSAFLDSTSERGRCFYRAQRLGPVTVW